MQNDSDLSHINKQIQRNNDNINEARHQAQNQRLMADQMREQENTNREAYYRQEVQRFENQARELEDTNEQLQNKKKETEQRISDLEDQRAQLEADYTSKLSQLDHELVQLRGSGMLL